MLKIEIEYRQNFKAEYCNMSVIQKFPDWLPGSRTANGTARCH